MIYFSSDFHLGHSRILGYSNREFSDVIEINEEIIRRHNELVKPNDTVYHLGDFSLNEKYVKEYLPQLNGTKHLISGNHEECFPARPKYKKSIRKYLSYGFSSVQEQMELFLGKRKFLLSHLPYANLEDKNQRYSQYRPIDNGDFLLHGHVHQAWLWNKRMINVGVDCWNFYPVSETKILDLVDEIIESEQL